ncbi:MAG TPA: metal-dependent transcriptional regulator [Plantibacter sp.]|uniref:metal-dependent transcriptional regulator n=1 Tax=unclassified Plantibacter TaxID=2624265 RepID=UPI002C31084E|nr:metal-dependent transcriptional regulator [Plantibacter sp.]
MSVSGLSPVSQDYLKTIWTTSEWADESATVKQLAERMGVRPATASDAVKRLAAQDLVVHEPYGSIELTEAGRAHAVAMVRRHRLIETFLVEMLGYGWDEVHDEAEILEHAASDTMIERIDAALGHPIRDPHGDPIPSADGTPHRPDAMQLSLAPADTALTVCRISDADPETLRHMGSLGIVLDTRLMVDAHRAFAGELELLLTDTGLRLTLGRIAADAVWVTVTA